VREQRIVWNAAPVLLLTGATGLVGSALLRRLTAAGEPVRCLVRDPRRLGPERVRVQIALGDLSDPPSFRNAMRGVRTVVHLGASIRDQPRGSIEELNGIATWRMVEAAERAGVERFVFFSALSASAHNRTRFLRAKALAEEAVRDSSLAHTIFAPSIVYAPGDSYMTLLNRMALLPVMPISGSGKALYEPIWAHDVADCVVAALDAGDAARERYELAGPETLSHREIVELALRAQHRHRPIVHVPTPIVSRTLRFVEALMKSKAPATWDEAELMEVSMLAAEGSADAETLGVRPRHMAAVLDAP
jgi:NADH dehydrogenase